MSKPICYAIMPYGGKDEKLQNHFAEVFNYILKHLQKNVDMR